MITQKTTVADESMHRLAGNLEEAYKLHGNHGVLVMPADVVLDMAREILEQRQVIAGLRAGLHVSMS